MSEVEKAEEILFSVSVINDEINQIEEHINELRESLGVKGINFDERIQTVSKDVHLSEKKQAEIATLQLIAREKQIELFKEKIRITDMIHKLSNINEIRFLRYKYIELKRLEDIASIMNYSYNYVRNDLRTNALINFYNSVQKSADS